jgi:hypothetical protein
MTHSKHEFRLTLLRSERSFPRRGTLPIALWLIDRFNFEKGYAYPPLDWLVGASGRSKAAVRREIDWLVANGWFDRRSGGGRGKASEYAPCWARIAPNGAEKHAPLEEHLSPETCSSQEETCSSESENVLVQESTQPESFNRNYNQETRSYSELPSGRQSHTQTASGLRPDGAPSAPARARVRATPPGKPGAVRLSPVGLDQISNDAAFVRQTEQWLRANGHRRDLADRELEALIRCRSRLDQLQMFQHQDGGVAGWAHRILDELCPLIEDLETKPREVPQRKRPGPVPKGPPSPVLAAALKRWRERQDISQYAMAKELGVTRSYLAAAEQAHRHITGKLATALAARGFAPNGKDH